MKTLLRNFSLALSALTLIIFCSACTPSISIQANGADGASLTLKTGFSPLLEKTFKSMMQSISSKDSGNTENTTLFSKENIAAVMEAAGFINVTASTPDTGTVSARGNIAGISKSALAKAGILFRTQNSLSLALGPKQFQALYAMLDEESQAYFDLMMIPALNDDSMTLSQYGELLSSVYGQKFADEITQGSLLVTLSSPDGKKKKDVEAKLGEILTLNEEKKWTVQW